jgi:endonuclease/exonuclease/phosphatase family metal-dependent hydrolase
MSFNVRVWTRDRDKKSPYYWKTRMEKMKQMITIVNPDIICFQELSFPANLYVPKEYKRVGLSISHPIYIRKNMSFTKHTFNIHMDSAIVRGYLIINVHSHWNKKILKRNCKQIEKFAKHRIEVIVCGDFNNKELDINLPSFTHVSFDHNIDTFVNFKRPLESHGVIDHFYSKNVPLSSVKVLYGYGEISDHRPIICETNYTIKVSLS